MTRAKVTILPVSVCDLPAACESCAFAVTARGLPHLQAAGRVAARKGVVHLCDDFGFVREKDVVASVCELDYAGLRYGGMEGVNGP